MPDLETKPITTETIPDQKVIVGGTGDGTIKTQLLVTPEGQPNVQVHLVPTALAVLIGFANTFLTTLVTLVGAGLTTSIIPASSFLQLVWKCATLSVAGAGLGMLKDLVVIAGRLKKRFPLLDV